MKRILQGWHFVRVLRLVLGIIIVWQSILQQEWAIAIIGMLLALLAIINVGCCTVNTGAVRRPVNMDSDRLTDDIVYEEVKGD
ncbi:MAG TPA: hypothetical protein VG738_25380 [Chitinophagaceae bacterium]|nr:hypothetical protein [Chitinophagaceae bacterium]